MISHHVRCFITKMTRVRCNDGRKHIIKNKTHTEIVILAFEYHSVFIYSSIFLFFYSNRIQPSKFIPTALAGRCVRLLQRKGCFVCLMCCSETVLLCARGTTDEHPSFRCVLWGTSVFRPSVSYANSTSANIFLRPNSELCSETLLDQTYGIKGMSKFKRQYRRGGTERNIFRSLDIPKSLFITYQEARRSFNLWSYYQSSS